MLGLLLGGLLKGAMSRGRSQGSRSAPPSNPPSRAAPMTPEAETPDQQSARPDPPAQQPTQQQQQPFVKTISAELTKPAEAQQAQMQAQSTPAQSPISGLMDEAPSSPQPAQQGGEDGKIQPQSVVNTDDDVLSPTARPQQESLGEVPQAKPPDLAGQLFSEIPRSDFQYQEGMPSKQPDISSQSYTSDQGFRYVGPQSVAEGVPRLSYRGRRR